MRRNGQRLAGDPNEQNSEQQRRLKKENAELMEQYIVEHEQKLKREKKRAKNLEEIKGWESELAFKVAMREAAEQKHEFFKQALIVFIKAGTRTAGGPISSATFPLSLSEQLKLRKKRVNSADTNHSSSNATAADDLIHQVAKQCRQLMIASPLGSMEETNNKMGQICSSGFKNLLLALESDGQKKNRDNSDQRIRSTEESAPSLPAGAVGKSNIGQVVDIAQDQMDEGCSNKCRILTSPGTANVGVLFANADGRGDLIITLPSIDTHTESAKVGVGQHENRRLSAKFCGAESKKSCSFGPNSPFSFCTFCLVGFGLVLVMIAFVGIIFCFVYGMPFN